MSEPPPLPCPENSKGEGNCMGVDVGRYLNTTPVLHMRSKR